MEGSAIQSGESSELGRMTSDEAQAVIDLWAQRQRQFEDEATMPSTAELAEALNVPESDIAAMLRRARGEADAVQSKLLNSPVVLSLPKRLLILLAASLFLGLVVSFLESNSKRIPRTSDLAVVPTFDAAIAPPFEGMPSSMPGQSGMLPAGLSVRFDSEVLMSSGTVAANTSNERLHEMTRQTIEAFVRKQSNLPKVLPDHALDKAVLIRSLLAGNDTFSDFVLWRNLDITIGADTISSRIPICIHDHKDTIEAVNNEVARRVSKLSSQAVEKFRTVQKNTDSVAPPTGR